MSASMIADILELMSRRIRQAAEDGEDGIALLRDQLADGLQPRRLTTMPTNNESDALLTAQDLADYLGCNVRSLRRWRHMGLLPAPLLIGGVQRWRRADVDRRLGEGR